MKRQQNIKQHIRERRIISVPQDVKYLLKKIHRNILMIHLKSQMIAAVVDIVRGLPLTKKVIEDG